MTKLIPTLLVIVAVLTLAACQTGGASPAPATSGAATSSAAPSDADASASGAGSASPSAEAPLEPEMRQVRVGYTSPDFAQIVPFKWAEELEAQGIEVELIEFESGNVVNRALVAGEVDFALASVLSVVQLAQEAGGGVRIIAADNTVPDYVMLAPTSISSVQDLVGKRLGISGPGDISDVLSKLALQRSGVDPDSVEIVQIGGTNARIAGLVSGQIEAGIAHAAEAYAALETNEGIHDILTIGEVVPDLLQRGLLTTDSFIDQNPNLTQIMVDEFVDAIRWAATNKEEYIALSQEYVEGLSDDIRSRAYDTFIEIGLFGVNGGVGEENLQAVLDLNKEIGTLDDDAPEPEEWANTSFVENYLARNGEF